MCLMCFVDLIAKRMWCIITEIVSAQHFPFLCMQSYLNSINDIVINWNSIRPYPLDEDNQVSWDYMQA